MRTLITFAFAILLLTSCNDKPVYTKDVKLSARDTALTVVAYSHDWSKNDHRIASALRIVHDTLLPDPKDPVRNISTRDTSYQVYQTKILADSVTRKPKLDSLGKPITVYVLEGLPKSFLLQDYNKRY